jgi:hypothetical protein
MIYDFEGLSDGSRLAFCDLFTRLSLMELLIDDAVCDGGGVCAMSMR